MSDFEFKKSVILSASMDIAQHINDNFGIIVDELDIAEIVNHHLEFVFDIADSYTFIDCVEDYYESDVDY